VVKREVGTGLEAMAIESASGVTLHRQVYRSILDSILSGRLGPGARVPSTRTLSRLTGISRNSVTHGYEELRAEGYLESRVGSGTYVCGRLPESASRKRRQSKLQAAGQKLTSLIAASGYPVEEIGFEDCEGNAVYLYSSGEARKRN
jgi:GntR family transcriptional regulator/MocR family aminotransferase